MAVPPPRPTFATDSVRRFKRRVSCCAPMVPNTAVAAPRHNATHRIRRAKASAR